MILRKSFKAINFKDINMKLLFSTLAISFFSFSCLGQDCYKIKIFVIDSVTNIPIENVILTPNYFNGNRYFRRNRFSNNKGQINMKNKEGALSKNGNMSFSVFHVQYFYKNKIKIIPDENCNFIIYLQPSPNWKEKVKEVTIR